MRIWWIATALVLGGCVYSGDGGYGSGDQGYQYDNGHRGDRDEDRRRNDGYHRDGDSGGYRPGGRPDDGYHRDGDAGGYRNGDHHDGHHGRKGKDKDDDRHGD